MTIEQIDEMILALAEAERLHRDEFDIWYSIADMPSVESFARTGWMLFRLKVELENREPRVD